MSAEMSVYEVVKRIETLNLGLARFWTEAHGWAPIEAAGLLGKSRLDWQASLSSSLRLWLPTPPASLSDGELILAWTNLGSLIEGTLKLMLSVFYENYRQDIDKLKKAGAFHHKKQEPVSPDNLSLDVLRKYVRERELVGTDGDTLIELVQKRRNAIHAYQDRPIGNDQEFQGAVRSYLVMLHAVNNRLPYPDDIYAPRDF